MQGLHTVTGLKFNHLSHRPFFVWWFMIHITRYVISLCFYRKLTVARLLNMWAVDNSMTEAIHLCFPFLGPIDYLSAIWPCESAFSSFHSYNEFKRVKFRSAQQVYGHKTATRGCLYKNWNTAATTTELPSPGDRFACTVNLISFTSHTFPFLSWFQVLYNFGTILFA